MRIRTLIIAALAALAGIVGVGTAAAAIYPSPADTMQRGSAAVDGNPMEWAYTTDAGTANTYRDFFAYMYRAGRSDLGKPVESMLYLRYNCTRRTAYVLVMAKSGVKVLVNGDQYVKFGQTDVKVSAGSSNFKFVGQSGNYAEGWEASFPMTGNISDLNVHAQVFDGGGQTSAVDQRSIPAKIPTCSGADPDVTIGISPAPVKTGKYGWNVTKAANPVSVTGSNPITYTVTATRNGPNDIRYRVNGTFTATSTTALSGASADAFTTGPGSGPCTITGDYTSLSFNANVGRTFSFTCDETTSAPTGVTARVTVPFVGSWATSTAVSWSGVVPNYLHERIYITDAQAGGSSLPTTGSPYSGAGQSWTYNKTWDAPGSGCTPYNNTATLYSKDDGFTPISATATVQVCSPGSVAVNGTATPSYTRTYAWSLAKVIDANYPCTQRDIDVSGTAISCLVNWDSTETSTQVPYTVSVTKTTQGDSAFAVAGSFTVSVGSGSPPSSSITSISATSLSNCTITGQTLPITVSSYPRTFNYSCTGSATATTSGNVSVSVTPSGGSATTYDLPFSFAGVTPTKVNDTATVTDTFDGSTTTLGTSISADTSWPEPRRVSVPTDPGCRNYVNTATMTGTTSNPPSVTRTVRICRTGVDISVTPQKSKTGRYGWTVTKTADQASVTGSTPINYTVTATRTGPNDVKYGVSGSFSATSSSALTGAALEVVTTGPGGDTCVISGSTSGLSFAAGTPRTFSFTCPDANAAPTGVTARVLVPSVNTWSGSATLDWSSVTPQYLHQQIYISDDQVSGTGLPTSGSPYSGAGTTWNYSKTWDVPGSGCTSYPNTVTLSSKDAGFTDITSTATVQVCAPSAVSVSGTADPAYTRTYAWTLSKIIDPSYQCTQRDVVVSGTTISCLVNWDSADATTEVPYTVSVAKTTQGDSAFAVTGSFTLTSTVGSPPSSSVTSISATSLSNCTITGQTLPITVSSYPQTFNYSCTGSATASTSGNVSVSVTPSGDSARTYNLPFNFASATPTKVNDSATVVDTFEGTESVLSNARTTSGTLSDPHVLDVPSTMTCRDWVNTASVRGTTSNPSPVTRTVRICRTTPPPLGEVLLDVAVDGQYTRTWGWDISKRLTGVQMLDRAQPTDPPKARFSYRVALAQRPGGASGVQLRGTVGVTNKLTSALSGRLSVSIPEVTDEICGFESSNAITSLASLGSLGSRPAFTCYLDSVPTVPITPRVVLTQDGTPAQWARGGTIDFSSPTQVVVQENRPSVTLYDNFNGQGDTTKGEWANVGTDRVFTYTNDMVLDSSECVSVVNVARLFGVSPRPTASWTADYCPDLGAPAPLVASVERTLTPRATSEWSWSLSKRITSTEIDDQDVRITYEVTATKSGTASQSDFGFSGTLYVTNPNPWSVSGVSVAFRFTPTDPADAPDCRLTGSSSLTRTGVSFAANQTIALPFTCSTGSAGGGQISATMSGGGLPTSTFGGDAGVVRFTSALLGGSLRNNQVDVTDAFNGAAEVPLGDAVTATQSFTYTKLIPLTTGCTTYANVARLAGDSGYARSARASVQVCWQSSGDVVIVNSERVEKIGRVVTTSSSSETSTSTSSSTNSSNLSTFSLSNAGTVNSTRLTVSKTGPGSARRGQIVTYRLTITNNTSKTATPITITDALPKGMTFLPGRLPAGGMLVNNRVATFGVDSLAPGESVTLRYPARANASGRLCNRAIVKATGFAPARGQACVRVAGTVTAPVVTG